MRYNSITDSYTFWMQDLPYHPYELRESDGNFPLDLAADRKAMAKQQPDTKILFSGARIPSVMPAKTLAGA
jgi:hypothetical protein